MFTKNRYPINAWLIILLTFCCVKVATSQVDNPDIVQASKLIQSSPLEAERIVDKIINDSKLRNEFITLGYAHRLKGKIQALFSNNADEFEHLTKSREFFLMANNKKEIAESNRLLGEAYFQSRLRMQSKLYLDEAYEQFSALNDLMGMAKTQSNLGQIEFHSFNLDKAEEHFRNAIRIAELISNKSMQRESWNRLSYIYIRSGKNKEMALDCMRKAFRFKSANTDTLAVLYSDLGYAFLENEMLDSADLYINKGMNMIKLGNNKDQLYAMVWILSRLRYKQGRFQEAYEILRENEIMRDTLYTKRMEKTMINSNTRYQELKTKSLLEKEAQEDKIQNTVVFLLFILVVSVAFFLYRANVKGKLLIKNGLQLEESRKLYFETFESSLSLMLLHKLDGRITSVNKVIETSLGYDRSDMVGKNISDFIAPDFRWQFADYLKEIVTKGYSEGMLQVITSKGELRTLRYQNKLINTNGLQPFILGYAQDQTEIIRIKRELDQERKFMRLVMDLSPDIFLILKRDGTITFINKSKLLDAKNIIHGKIQELLPETTSVKFEEALHQIIEKDKIVEFEEMIRSQVFLFRLIPIKNVSSYDILVIMSDVTEAKRIENEVVKAKEAAEESNRLKTVFLGSLSHEVRTPLQSILSLAELIELPTTQASKRVEFINLIKQRTRDTQNIIESLLDLASIETGEFNNYPVQIDLVELLDKLFNNFHNEQFYKRSIKLRKRFNIASPCIIHIDVVHLQQVVLNLVKNAFKFTEVGGIILQLDENRNEFHISVIDTGIGIEQGKLSHVFKPFRQAHEGLSRSKGGIGLGLSICKNLVESWGGVISVASTPGQGSVFSFTIPKIDDFRV